MLVKAGFSYTWKLESKGEWKGAKLPRNMIVLAIVDRHKAHHEI
jgi:hypothetical protein